MPEIVRSLNDLGFAVARGCLSNIELDSLPSSTDASVQSPIALKRGAKA